MTDNKIKNGTKRCQHKVFSVNSVVAQEYYYANTKSKTKNMQKIICKSNFTFIVFFLKEIIDIEKMVPDIFLS